MDDIIILSNSKEFLHNILCAIKIYLKYELNLKVKDNYQIYPVAARGIDFVGYRHFYGYKLVRKTSIKRFKRILINANNKYLNINEKEWCACVSVIGWICWANSYNFACKYLFKLSGILGVYYYYNKKPEKYSMGRHNFSSWNIYTNQLQKHNKKIYVINHKPIHLKEAA
jgi:hypothetical protein